MFNHLKLIARQSTKPECAELFLSFENPERDTCVVTWSVKLPSNLERTASSMALSGSETILPTDRKTDVGRWVLSVLPLHGEVEREIEASAALTSKGSEFKSDSVRATLSELLRTK